MAVKKRMEDNPVFTSVGVIVLAATGLTALGTLTGFYNSSHTSEAELIASHPVRLEEFEALKESIVSGDALSKCRWLKSEIRALEDSIYVRERDNASPDFIRALKLDLKELKEQYDDLSCTRRLNST